MSTLCPHNYQLNKSDGIYYCTMCDSRMIISSVILPGNHEFKGRLDRDCEVCHKPDRHPIHSTKKGNH